MPTLVVGMLKVFVTAIVLDFIFPAMISLVMAAGDLDSLEQKAINDAVDRVAPSVVRIETIGGLEQVEDVRFGTGPTTGLVIDPEGYIVSSAFALQQQTGLDSRSPGRWHAQAGQTSGHGPCADDRAFEDRRR